MPRLVSFHPVDPAFFQEVVQPLVTGGRMNPEPFLAAALRHRVGAWAARRHVTVLDTLLEQSVPPPPPASGTLWEKVRARLEVFDFKADPLATMVRHAVQKDVHLRGRPYLIAEESPAAVGRLVSRFEAVAGHIEAEDLVEDQLRLFKPDLSGRIVPDGDTTMPPDLAYREELMEGLRELHALPKAARRGESWDDAHGHAVPASQCLEQVAWRAVWLHSRLHPFWMGEDIRGLAGICRLAGVLPPEDLMPAGLTLGGLGGEFPRLLESLGTDATAEQAIGGYVAPGDLPGVVDFLKQQGGTLIQAATRHGEGGRCARLLAKIRECMSFAVEHGRGYLEATGIEPVGPATPAGPASGH